MLDNASDDGSAEAVRERGGAAAADRARAAAPARRRTTRRCCARRAGRYCLLLNEDSELQPGRQPRALLDALEADPRAAAATPQHLTSEGEPKACAWRLPGVGPALAVALGVQGPLVVQSRGDARARGGLGAVERADGAARGGRAGGLPRPGLLRLLRRDRLLQAPARRRLADPLRAGRRAPSTTTSWAPTRPSMRRRIVEFHRGRDLYMRKHHSAPGAAGRAPALDVGLRRARAGRARPPRPRPAPLPAARRARSCGPGAARASARRRRPTTAGSRR